MLAKYRKIISIASIAATVMALIPQQIYAEGNPFLLDNTDQTAVLSDTDTDDKSAQLDFSSMRLVIGTTDTSVVAGDKCIIDGYEGVYLAKYPTEEETENAYAYYTEKADFVEPDVALIAAGEDDTENAIVLTDSSAEDTSTNEQNTNNPITTLKDMQEENPSGNYTIALIDTGASEYTSETVSMLDDDGQDKNGHATQMAKYIADTAPDASILSVKALNDQGNGTISSVYAAIEYAVSQKVRIINLSLSGYAMSDSQCIDDAVKEATDAGIVVVGAAGNNGRDAKYCIPGRIDSAYIVGACDENGTRIASSNYGNSVDYNIVAGSTSDAAAKFTGYIASLMLATQNWKNQIDTKNGLVYRTHGNEQTEEAGTADTSNVSEPAEKETELQAADESGNVHVDLVKGGKVDIMLMSRNTNFTTEQMQQLESKIKSEMPGYDINFVGLETKEVTTSASSYTAESIYNGWDQFPSPNNYSLQGDYIINAIYNEYNNPYWQVITRSTQGKFNQLFIENNSWNTKDFSLSCDYIWHGCGWSSGFIFHWDKKTDTAYKIDMGVDNIIAIKKVSNVTQYIGQQVHYDTIGTILASTTNAAMTPTMYAMGTGPLKPAKVTIEMKGNKISIYDGNHNAVLTYTDPDPIESGGIGLWAGCTVAYRNVSMTYERTVSKTMTEILRQATWRDEALHIVIDVDNQLDPSLVNSGEMTSRLIADDAYLQFWGSDTNKSSFTTYGQGFGKDENGIDKYNFVNQSEGYDACVTSTNNYIKKILSSYNDSEYGIINEVKDISVTPASAKNNTADSTYPNGKWKIIHDGTKLAGEALQNSMGTSSQSGMYMSNLACSFNKPGDYTIYYMDVPIKTVYIHRRPVADFTIGWNPSTKAVTIGDTSYDLDTNKGTKGNGIQSVTWQYKKATAGTWTNGYPTTWQASDGIVIIQMTVTDYQGCSSSVAKYLGDAKPVASFSFNLNPVSLYENISVLNSSYDTSGYQITKSSWVLKDANGKQIATNSTNKVGDSFSLGTPAGLGMHEGIYTLQLTVTNSAGTSSESVSRTFRVVKVTYHALYEYNWAGGTHGTYPEYTEVSYKATYPELAQPSKKYRVDFNINTGTAVDTAYKEANASFSGWYLDSALTQKITSGSTIVNSNGNHTIYAKWTNNNVTFPNAGKSYTVSFDAQNTATDIATGNTSPLTETWTFNGWYDNKSGGNLIGKAGTNYTLSENKTLYAQWTDVPVTLPNLSKKFTVQFNTNGGSACNPVTANVKFNGWYTAVSGGDYVGTGGNKYTVNSNHTLYAHWSNADITMPLSTKKGYTFAGWNTQADGKGTSYAADTTINTITADNGATITLYAQWKIKSSEIQVDINLPDRKIKDTNHPTVIIKLSGKDMDGNHVTKVLPYTFSSSGKQSKTVTLKAGNYTITEILPARYKVDSIKGPSTMKANGNSAAIDFTDAADSTICFEQKCITSAYISGSDQKINTI